MNSRKNKQHFKGRTLTALLFFLLISFNSAWAQTYAPAVGQPGTSAIYKDSSVFVNWATDCTLNRGYQDISNPGLGVATAGDKTMACGKAQSNGIVSLGDGGYAICTFENAIRNGPGYDFAVFENGFDDTFLELAFVSVSSDGVNFFRFSSHSLSDTVTQTNGFGPTDATKINNLAGKYRGGYGTPFDLQELSGMQGLDIQHITHVKITDVIGSLNNAYASRDAYHNKINDPWPTPFPSGGFDLDAIGVIYENKITGLTDHSARVELKLYPNPVRAGDRLFVGSGDTSSKAELLNCNGQVLSSGTTGELDTSGLEKGIYIVRISTANGFKTTKLVVL